MSYVVYLHTVPKEVTGHSYDKYYVGISSKLNVEDRWGIEGQGYRGQVFYLAIKKYGWNNIRHDVLFEGLSHKDALEKEKELIKYYKSSVKNGHGYNILSGGSKYNNSRIYQFDSYGNVINIFDNYDVLYVETGIIPQDVHSACIGRYIQSGGFVWRYEKDIKDLEIFKNELKSKRIRCIEPICQYDLNSNFIKRWDNSLALHGYFKNSRGIRKICNNVSSLQSFGYLWRYEKDVEIFGKPIYERKPTRPLRDDLYVDRVVRISLEGISQGVYPSLKYLNKNLGLSYRIIKDAIKSHEIRYGSFWEYEKNLINSKSIAFYYSHNDRKFCLGLVRGDGSILKYLGSIRESSKKLGIERENVKYLLDNHIEYEDDKFIEILSTLEVRYGGE